MSILKDVNAYSNTLLIGTDGNDDLRTGAGSDILTGKGGNDTLYAGAGRDSIEGGAGYDTALYTGKVTDYAVLFTTDGKVEVIDKVTSDGDDGTDILTGVEQINFAGDGVTRIVTGSAANDHLTNDKYWSMMFGGYGNDTLTAAYGDDTLVGGAGNDTLDGQSGYDTVVYNGQQIIDYDAQFFRDGRVRVSDKVTSNGDDGIDILTGVEQINFADDRVIRIIQGGPAPENLTNDKHWSMMFGGQGDDTLTAASGYDTLVGGAGNDILFGGAGADKFVLYPSLQGGIDVIKDFDRRKGDKIQIEYSPHITSTNQFSFDAKNGALFFGGLKFATIENAAYFTPSLDLTIGYEL